MNKQLILSRIGTGVRLRTVARGHPFDLYADDAGLTFVSASSGNPRRTPWDGPMWGSTSVVDLYDQWDDAGRPSDGGTAWLKGAVERAGLPQYRNRSALLATFHFVGGMIEAEPVP